MTATDSDGISATLAVTVKVTGVDEMPVVMLGGLVISGMTRVDYAEDRTDAVATYSVTGPESANARWTTLGGDDAGDFSISTGGVLSFRSGSAPDYETKSTYMVTVKADDGTYMDTHEVTVRITTDVVEMPVTDGTLLERYAGDDGILQRGEVITAIRDHIRATPSDPNAISKVDVIKLIRLFIRS